MTPVDEQVRYQVQLWEPQKQQRLELGDRLDQSRQMDQFAFFRRRKGAEAAARDLEAQGFATQVSRRGLKHALTAQRDEVLTDDGLHAFLVTVITAVATNGGAYDGFGGTIVP